MTVDKAEAMSQPEKVRIEVLLQDIYAGTPRDGGRCPIALAFYRAIPQAWDVAVEDDWAEVILESQEELNFKLPAVAHDFVNSFDEAPEAALPIQFDAHLIHYEPEDFDA